MEHHLLSPCKLVIFDFDGTLADSADWMIGQLNLLADKHRFRRVDDAEIAMLRGRSNREIIRYLRIRPWRMPWIARDFRRRSAAAASTIALFPGVAAMFAALADAGIQIAIVSSNAEATIRQVLGPLAAKVQSFGCGVSLFGKARTLRAVARRLGVAAADVLCIGDEGRDIEAAHKAGFAAVAVTWGYADASVLRALAPRAVVGSITELIQRLTGQPRP